MKTSLSILMVLFALSAMAQWSNPDSNGKIYYNGGNVGIGTTAPDNPVQINGSIAALSLLPQNTGSNGARTYLTSFAGKSSIQSDKDFTIRTNFGEWADRFIVTNAGNVGIGTATPSVKFEVAGQDITFYSATLTNTLSIGRNASEKFSLVATDGHGWLDYVQDEDANSAHIFYIRNLAQGTSSDNDIRFQTGTADRLIIKPDGRIGIGTPTPDAALEIMGGTLPVGSPTLMINNTYATYSADASENRPLTIRRVASDAEALSVFLQDQNTHFVYKNDEKSGSIDYRVINTDTESGGGAQANDNVVMTLVGNQNGAFVGIGTTTPDYELTVDGKVKCEEVKVEIIAGTGPDYVFEASYDLPSLSEVEAYIKANKHLPEVPSAKEMEENGLNLKEMNLLLLKKVEELTLHLIDQSRSLSAERTENLKQKEEISMLREKIEKLSTK